MEAKPATNNNDMRTGAPDSDSRSVEREGAQASARDIVKWGAIAAAPAPQASLTVSRQPRPSGLRQNAASAALRSSVSYFEYDLRRAPRIHPHFASNAIRGGLNQRFRYYTNPQAISSHSSA